MVLEVKIPEIEDAEWQKTLNSLPLSRFAFYYVLLKAELLTG